jgi:hypothetical protein
MRRARTVLRRGLPLLAALALCGMARPPPPRAEPGRRPVIRPADAAFEAAHRERIEELRAKLPGRSARRNNMAWARVQIEGLEKTEYFAHSGIQRLGKFSVEARQEIREISVRPRRGRFEVLCVNHNDEVNGPNCFFRNSDTERKILEELAGRLPDPAARGTVLLYTDLYPCASCRHVMGQFLSIYTNVAMEVFFRDR